MDNKFYTYAYLREDGRPYYIGKGCGRRAYEKHGRKVKTPSKDRILMLKRNLTEAEAFRHEVYMISVLGREINGGILLNFTDGGEGATGNKHTPETRQKMSKSRKGRKQSKEWVENRVKAVTGRKRKPHTEEHKQKISQALKGKSPSPEHRANLSKSQKGRVLTPEHRQKLSEATKRHHAKMRETEPPTA
jgi:hypothetical protein